MRKETQTTDMTTLMRKLEAEGFRIAVEPIEFTAVVSIYRDERPTFKIIARQSDNWKNVTTEVVESLNISSELAQKTNGRMYTFDKFRSVELLIELTKLNTCELYTVILELENSQTNPIELKNIKT